MTEDSPNLSEQIAGLEKRIDKLCDYLKSALDYLSSDPQSSLTKCRIVLEKILTSIYIREMEKEPSKVMIGNLLSDKEFAKRIPPRIRARMNFIREIANLGPHGGEVDFEDANRVLRDVVDLAEWYVSKYDPANLAQVENAQFVELLPDLKARYAEYLRPNITSVRLKQMMGRCYLEIRTEQLSTGYYPPLHNVEIKLTDLGFIATGDSIGDSDDDDRPLFDPGKSISENARTFVGEFDEISIINCTDLFTEQAATVIYENWREHGKDTAQPNDSNVFLSP